MSRFALSKDASLRLMAEAINEAVGLLESAKISPPTTTELQPPKVSLLEECLELCRRSQGQQVDPIRTIHHFACTGGTVISKCIAAMPNVQLLSEVDPLSTLGGPRGKPRFAPTDMISLLTQGTRPVSQEDIIEAFVAQLQTALARANAAGRYLVLRDHTHSHFCTGDAIPARPSLREIVGAAGPVVSLVTVRDPVDSYTSLVANNWVHFQPNDFDTYCKRYLAFLDEYATVPIITYEQFVEQPDETIEKMCSALRLPYRDGFARLIPMFQFSGGSGRGSNVISRRPPRNESDAYKQEAATSSAYQTILQKVKTNRI